MTGSLFDPAGLASLKQDYPETVCKLGHNLSGHPLMTLPAMVELATRLRPEDVEYNQGDLPVGIAPKDVPAPKLNVADTIRSIEQNGSWMALKFIENVPEYRALLETLLAEVEPALRGKTGPIHDLQGFIFVSAAEAVTPFHFDPEHNILLQIRGDKVLTTFPADDERLADGPVHEAFALGARHRNLDWCDEFASLGKPHRLEAGEALYLPVKIPHWVKNGPELSISLSLTWRSKWSTDEARALSFNAMLRRGGLEPRSPGRWPASNFAKAYCWRIARWMWRSIPVFSSGAKDKAFRAFARRG